MNLEDRLHEAVHPSALRRHPFYQAWSEGTLPIGSMRRYAAQYGAWIEEVAAGWDAIGESSYAEEERRHVGLWRAFSEALGALPAPPERGVQALLDTARSHYPDRASAIGALYAFETQQAPTAATKLMGLRCHYDLGADAEAYFEAHLDGGSETALLLSEMTKLDAVEQGRAVVACAHTARALWDALGDFDAA